MTARVRVFIAICDGAAQTTQPGEVMPHVLAVCLGMSHLGAAALGGLRSVQRWGSG